MSTAIAPTSERRSCSLENYLVLSDHSMDARIAAAKRELGPRVVVLGHHYQRDEVIRFADFRGDSYKLAHEAAKTSAQYIVFCGVHFMAESADVLAQAGQQVILPDLNAGCSMADMAEIGQVESCWDQLVAMGLTDDDHPSKPKPGSPPSHPAKTGHGGSPGSGDPGHGERRKNSTPSLPLIDAGKRRSRSKSEEPWQKRKTNQAKSRIRSAFFCVHLRLTLTRTVS